MMILSAKALEKNSKITKSKKFNKKPISSVSLKEVSNNPKLPRPASVTVFPNPKKISQPESLMISNSPSLKVRPQGTSIASGQLTWKLTLRN